MTDRSNSTIICGTHGEVAPAYVCQHLSMDAPTPAGFNEPDPDPDFDPDLESDDLQAWCNACDAVLASEGEWNESSETFADIRLICEFCFAKLRALHTIGA